CGPNQVSSMTAWVGKPERDKRTYYRRKVTSEKCAYPPKNSRLQRLVEHAANNLRLVPRNIMLAGLQILAGWRANDLVGKQRDQTTINWCEFRRRPQPRHLPVKGSRQSRPIGKRKMGDRGDPRIHLYEPGLIRRIKHEVKTDKARQIEAFHHMFSDHRHLRMIDESDDARRPVLVL